MKVYFMMVCKVGTFWDCGGGGVRLLIKMKTGF